MLLAIFLIALGIALLYFGGELLVDNSIRLAQRFSVSKIVIGLTVVAFGTSCPELATSLTAVLEGADDIAVSNVFGSNVANLALILGISALLIPLTVTVAFLKREVAFMIFATLLVYPFMVNGRLGRLEGLVLFLFLIGFIYVLLRSPSAQDEHMVPDDDEMAKAPRAVWLSTLGVAVGIGILVGGAEALVKGARIVALEIGISELVIGFTVVAFGTSLPELAASIVATRKGEGDIVMGNLIGSNIFNLLCILGLTSLVTPIKVNPAAMQSDYWMMMGVSLLLLTFLVTKRRLARWEGGILILIYVIYAVYLFQKTPV